MVRVVRVLAAALVLACALAPGGEAREPRLGPGDVVRLIVPNRAELTGSFAIRADGTISLPSLGRVAVSGLTLADAAAGLERAMMDRLGAVAANIAMEVETYRPVLVGGDVARPGEHPYRPMMTAGHAIALAGGPRRIESSNALIALEVSRERDRIRRSRDELAAALLRQDQLRQELRLPVVSHVRPAIDLVGPARAAQLRSNEADLGRRRVELHAIVVAALTQRSQVNREEGAALAAQAAALSQQAELLREELGRLTTGGQGNFFPANRLLQLRQDLANVEGRRSESLALQARSRSEGLVLDSQLAAADRTRDLELTAQLAETESVIIRLAGGLDEAERTMPELLVELPEPSAWALRGRMQIWRLDGAVLRCLQATQVTEMWPGDLLRVGQDAAADCPASFAGATP